MDWWLIGLRVVHVGSAMAWFGGAHHRRVLPVPDGESAGRSGEQPFMDQLMNSRRMGVVLPDRGGPGGPQWRRAVLARLRAA